jgi:hypothetical protein
MNKSRKLIVAAALAAALAVEGCGSSKNCNDSATAVSQAPTSCAAQVGAQVTVPLHVCPKCDQGTPTCDVRAQAGTIFVEPVAPVCDPNSSCPLVDPASCPFSALNCQFTAPPPDTSNTFTVVVITPDSQITFPLTVSTGSGSPPAVSCSL